MSRSFWPCAVVFVLPICFVRCGTDTSSGDTAEPNASYSIAVRTEADLPECDADRLGQLVFIDDTDEFKVCEEEGWADIDVKGEKGNTGETGSAGTDGNEGPQGETGPPGADGSDWQDSRAALVDDLEWLEWGILALACTDSQGDTFLGSGTKISSTQVITALHVVDGMASCVYYTDVLNIGSGVPVVSQLGTRDIAIVSGISFNSTGLILPDLTPIADYAPAIGEELLLVSYPGSFLERQFSFGSVADTSVITYVATLWENAISTDMAATGGSSGGPIFNMAGEFIGIHVGGFDTTGGPEQNIQLLFESE